MCAKNHLLIFSSFLDIWENVEWPRFFWTTLYIHRRRRSAAHVVVLLLDWRRLVYLPLQFASLICQRLMPATRTPWSKAPSPLLLDAHHHHHHGTLLAMLQMRTPPPPPTDALNSRKQCFIHAARVV